MSKGKNQFSFFKPRKAQKVICEERREREREERGVNRTMTEVIKHFCTIHKGKRAIIYCDKCGSYLCKGCLSTSHKDRNKSHSPTFMWVSSFEDYEDLPPKRTKDDDDDDGTDSKSNVPITTDRKSTSHVKKGNIIHYVHAYPLLFSSPIIEHI